MNATMRPIKESVYGLFGLTDPYASIQNFYLSVECPNADYLFQRPDNTSIIVGT